MAETRETKMKWYSPLALADRANDGFLSIARSAGKTARFIQSGAMGGPSKIEQGLFREKKGVADRANDGFLSIARSAGKAARFIQSGATGGPSKIEHELSGEKKEEKSGQPGRAREIKESGLTDETPEESIKDDILADLFEGLPKDETPEDGGSSPL